MGNRNRFKYKCADCGWTGFFSLQEFARRCRPRCGECGCTMLDPTNASKRIMAHDAAAVIASDKRKRVRAGGI